MRFINAFYGPFSDRQRIFCPLSYPPTLDGRREKGFIFSRIVFTFNGGKWLSISFIHYNNESAFSRELRASMREGSLRPVLDNGIFRQLFKNAVCTT